MNLFYGKHPWNCTMNGTIFVMRASWEEIANSQPARVVESIVTVTFAIPTRIGSSSIPIHQNRASTATVTG